MKNLMKKATAICIALVTVTSFMACNDDSDDDVTIQPTEISIGFGFELAPQGVSAKTITHNYQYTGYDVTITGGVADGLLELTDVDLTVPIQVEVLGEIKVTVEHPDFKGSELSTTAYYGVDEHKIYPSDINVINLKLVQGFVLVSVDSEIAHVIDKMFINEYDKTDSFDIIFYTSTYIISVDVKIQGGMLSGKHPNVLGKGKHYKVTTVGGEIGFTFPVFDDPGDGIWFP